eukprot:scaffold2934_cov176-Amphora_coffeaeformis.AAC.12
MTGDGCLELYVLFANVEDNATESLDGAEKEKSLVDLLETISPFTPSNNLKRPKSFMSFEDRARLEAAHWVFEWMVNHSVANLHTKKFPSQHGCCCWYKRQMWQAPVSEPKGRTLPDGSFAEKSSLLWPPKPIGLTLSFQRGTCKARTPG